MFFSKPIHDLTFEDVVAFCKRQIPEGKQLDYKYLLPKNKEKFAKVIASFANAMGGLVIVGVNDDKNDKPRPPFTGIAYHEKIRNMIEDIIQAYIDPVVFVDINICVSKDGQRMFVVIDIPQSNLTPHLVGPLKRAYIRTGQSSRPEAIVHPSRLPWLLDHRKKSERLRHILHDKADSHFENYVKTKNANMNSLSVASLTLLPLYPEEPLMPYQNMPATLRQCAPQLWDKAFSFQPVQDGAAMIDTASASHCMWEFNSYGLLMAKWNASHPASLNGQDTQAIDFHAFAATTVQFFQTALCFLGKLSFGGPLYFRLQMNKMRALQTHFKGQHATALEDYVRLDENYSLSQLQAQLPAILHHVLHTAAWSLGLQLTDAELNQLIGQLIAKPYEK